MGSLRIGLIVLISLSAVWATETAPSGEPGPKKDTSSPIVNTILCPFRAEPWACVREQASRMLVLLDVQLQAKSQELQAEADSELSKKMEARGFSATEIDPREKPSSVMQSVEDTLDTLTDGVEELISDRGEGEKDKKKKKKMKKKKKPSSGHHEEEEDDHEVIEWEEPDEHDFEIAQGHGHKHGQEEIKDAVDATVHEDANEEEEVEESGRFNGEVRGKKKKKKKALMKLLVLGAVLKGKIEMLLKVLSFHLQLKFFAIAVIGLLINLARFWVDVKKSHHPQKVIYYEHAQHQHHYDEHSDDGWGGYWKRSLNVGNEPSTEDDTYYSTNHYNNAPVAAAYTGGAAPLRPAAYQGASELAYNRQIPQTRYV